MRGADFSRTARIYARSRPLYPAELFRQLAALAPGGSLAWDCATGNGQAAVGLAEHFERVIATDVSAEQIEFAAAHPRIEYRVARGEASGLEGGSVDLITVASALHWFDLEAFYAEARRVARPGAVLAAWTYHVAHVEPPFDRVLGRLYDEVLQPFFAAGARLVDERYARVRLPGEALPVSAFVAEAAWTTDQIAGFIHSWSGSQNYLQEDGGPALAEAIAEIERLVQGHPGPHVLRWPLYLRAARIL